jgi:DNA-binding response OmpR family regulator
MTKVLLIDDDRELTGLLVEYLQEEGFDAHAVDDPRLGLEEATSNAYEIVILDVMMPRVNGMDVLQRIRRTSGIPILMLSARGENIDRIMGLNLGADDYVSKPCTPAEIVARLHRRDLPVSTTRLRSSSPGAKPQFAWANPAR